jgi:uncharacterized protein (TIGR02145 family)
MGGEAPGNNYFCTIEPEVGLINGKPYYKTLLTDCTTAYVPDVEPVYIWFSISGDYVNQWVVSELYNATIGNVFSYISSVAQDYPIGTWEVIDDQFFVYNSSLGDCPEFICFSIFQESVGDENPIAYQVELPILGNAPFQNGRPVYELGGGYPGSLYYDGSQWIYASEELAPLLQPLLNSSYYPIGTYSEWGDVTITGLMYSSTLGTCPTTTTTTTTFIPPGAIPIPVLLEYQTISPVEDIVVSNTLGDICLFFYNAAISNVNLGSFVFDITTYYYDEETSMLYNSVTNTFAEDGYYLSEPPLYVTNGLVETLTQEDVEGLCNFTTTTTTTLVPTTTSTTTECLNCVEEPVVIGTQTWDKCNLNVTTYANGDTIPEVTDPAVWASLTTGAWCYYDNDPLNEPIYGKLYNWYAVNDPRGLAPIGKSIPTDEDWTTLTDFLGGEEVAGGKMKEEGVCHWLTPNQDATNSSGFTGLGGGYRNDDGPFSDVGNYGFWWSSTEDDATIALFRLLNYNDSYASRNYLSKKYGASVRCLVDNTTTTTTTIPPTTTTTTTI